jgi:hypothetical protein
MFFEYAPSHGVFLLPASQYDRSLRPFLHVLLWWSASWTKCSRALAYCGRRDILCKLGKLAFVVATNPIIRSGLGKRVVANRWLPFLWAVKGTQMPSLQYIPRRPQYVWVAGFRPFPALSLPFLSRHFLQLWPGLFPRCLRSPESHSASLHPGI